MYIVKHIPCRGLFVFSFSFRLSFFLIFNRSPRSRKKKSSKVTRAPNVQRELEGTLLTRDGKVIHFPYVQQKGTRNLRHENAHATTHVLLTVKSLSFPLKTK